MAKAKRKKRNKFAGADDIYLTDHKVAVRKVSTIYDKFGNYRMYDKTRYYPKTRENLNQAKKPPNGGFLR